MTRRVTSKALLEVDEPPPFELINENGTGCAVLVCDHASNRVPLRLGNLGLGTCQLQDHIAWDPGAAEVARHLSAALDAPLVMSGYSRLVIDCNRPLHHAGSIALHSAGVSVPGNLGLSPEARALRIDSLFRPYHDAIERMLERRSRRPTLLLSIHSFTPVLHSRQRPWHVGVSHWRRREFADLLIGALRHDGKIMVGDNQPYPIEAGIDHTIPVHCEGSDLPNVMIEIRNNGIRSPDNVAAWAARLASAYRLIESEALRQTGH